MIRLLGLGMVVVWLASIEAIAQHAGDIQVQAQDGKVVVGSASLDAGDNTIGVVFGERVFSGMLMSNYRGTDPGFNSDPTGSSVLPAGVEGFGGGASLAFDILPMHANGTVTNLLYWDGLGEAGSPTLDDVDFATPPTDTTWTLVDDDFDFITADGSDAFVPGDVLGSTTGSGNLHRHRLIAVDDSDGNINTTPDPGIYLVSLQMRVDGLEPSDPVFVMSRSFEFDELAVDIAADWIDENYDQLTGNEVFPGDFNGDGLVDAADYTVWRDGFPIDFSQADYEAWAMNYGAASTQAITVPEPTTFVSVLTGGLLLIGRRRR